MALRRAYVLGMDNNEHPPRPTLAELSAQLEQSRADVAAGRTRPLDQVLAEMRAELAMMEREQAGNAA